MTGRRTRARRRKRDRRHQLGEGRRVSRRARDSLGSASRLCRLASPPTRHPVSRMVRAIPPGQLHLIMTVDLGVQGLNSHRPMVYLVAGSNPNPCPWVRSCRGRHVADLARGASAYLKPHSSRRRGVQAAPRRIAPQRPRALHRNRNPARRAGVSC